jgi:dihydroorotate dehydrogenase (fumarate)
MQLTTTYLGLKLKNPLVPSAGPLSRTLDTMKKLEDAGASAIVLYSLFEEQIEREDNALDYYLSFGTESYAEALSYFPRATDYIRGPEEYLEHIRKAKKALDIPLIASLNGNTPGGWTSCAKDIERAGADAIELNIYYIPSDPRMTSTQIEEQYIETLKSVKKSITIPIAVKLNPFFTNIADIAKRLVDNGTDGLVLFNRFLQPELDIEHLEATSSITLSTSSSLRLPLRWIAILYGKVHTGLAASNGVHTGIDALKAIMAGADVAMMCSAILKNGPSHVSAVLKEMTDWMSEHEYESIEQMKGSLSQKSVANPAAFERASYVKVLNNYKVTV